MRGAGHSVLRIERPGGLGLPHLDDGWLSP